MRQTPKAVGKIALTIHWNIELPALSDCGLWIADCGLRIVDCGLILGRDSGPVPERWDREASALVIFLLDRKLALMIAPALNTYLSVLATLECILEPCGARLYPAEDKSDAGTGKTHLSRVPHRY